MEYKRGRENRAADALSRVKHSLQNLIASAAQPAWITDVVKSYKNDKKCSEIIAETAINATSKPHFTFKHGILRYKNKIVVGSNTSIRQDLIQAFHKSELRGHSGKMLPTREYTNSSIGLASSKML